MPMCVQCGLVCVCVLRVHYGADVSTSLIWRDVAQRLRPMELLQKYHSPAPPHTIARLGTLLETDANFTTGVLRAQAWAANSNLKRLLLLRVSEDFLSVRAHAMRFLLKVVKLLFNWELRWKTQEGHWCLQAALRQAESHIQPLALALRKIHILATYEKEQTPTRPCMFRTTHFTFIP